jgi:hypothetical protein
MTEFVCSCTFVDRRSLEHVWGRDFGTDGCNDLTGTDTSSDVPSLLHKHACFMRQHVFINCGAPAIGRKRDASLIMKVVMEVD